MTDGSFIHDPQHESVLDVDVEKLASIYGKAVLNAAGSLEAQRGVMEELSAIHSEILVEYPDMERIFDSALVSEEEKMGIIARVFDGNLSPTAINFLKVLAQHNRLGFLRHIIRSANALWRERCDQISVKLELAQQVDQVLQQEIITILAKNLGGATPMVSVKINPDLIGGFIARVGDRVYDASIRTSLEHTRQSMIASSIESIQRQPHNYLH